MHSTNPIQDIMHNTHRILSTSSKLCTASYNIYLLALKVKYFHAGRSDFPQYKMDGSRSTCIDLSEADLQAALDQRSCAELREVLCWMLGWVVSFWPVGHGWIAQKIRSGIVHAAEKWIKLRGRGTLGDCRTGGADDGWSR